MTRPRSTYRHGDLRRALLDAGIALAREGGPDAVVLREATRRAGVVPNAAYRHFASHAELLEAVRQAALSAMAAAMQAELDRVPRRGAAAQRARAALRAIGMAYIGFAEREPGLFRTAFASAVPSVDRPRAPHAGTAAPEPFRLLGAALDGLVDAGVLPLARRPRAEYLAWSAVHGFAMLVITGPLRGLPRDARKVVVKELLDLVEKGL
jgi:AcrR family transcriptional regulator